MAGRRGPDVAGVTGSSDGPLSVADAWFRTARRRVRDALPILEYGTCAGVRVPPTAATPRRLFDRLYPGVDTPEHRSFEGALASVHGEHPRQSDAVVIVGGGYGITTVAAARAGADVTVFEPDPDRLAALDRTCRLNGVEPGAVDRRRAVVGELNVHEAAAKGLDPDAATVVPPDELPPCDVLELDCEGAELAILEGLDPADLPRVVAVEIHPIKLDGGTDAVLETLEALDYAIDRRLTHDGAVVGPGAFAKLLDGETPDVGDPDHQTFPPVVVARR